MSNFEFQIFNVLKIDQNGIDESRNKTITNLDHDN